MRVVTATAAALVLLAGLSFGQMSSSDSQQAMASKPDMTTGSMNVDQHLKNMENRWAKAAINRDSNTLNALLSDDFVNLDSDGSTRNKAETVSRTMQAKLDVSDLSDMQVTRHGDTAIVTGIWTGKGTTADGKPIDAKERWTDTWVKENGKWVCVASASTGMKKEQ